jgi:hypothetical protein
VKARLREAPPDSGGKLRPKELRTMHAHDVLQLAANMTDASDVVCVGVLLTGGCWSFIARAPEVYTLRALRLPLRRFMRCRYRKSTCDADIEYQRMNASVTRMQISSLGIHSIGRNPFVESRNQRPAAFVKDSFNDPTTSEQHPARRTTNNNPVDVIQRLLAACSFHMQIYYN